MSEYQGYAEAECLIDSRSMLGEGPIWVAAESALYWVDIKEPSVNRYSLGTQKTHKWQMPGQIGFILPRRSGGFVVGMQGRLFLLSPEMEILQPLSEFQVDDPDNRLNDGFCDPQGRLWFGTMDDGEVRDSGALYRLGRDDRVKLMDDGYCITNGPVISPDGASLYHNCSNERRIYVFDLSDDGTLSNKRIFYELSEDEGFPDGMTVDSEGGIWCAFWGGAQVVRFDPNGSKIGSLCVPVPNVSSCIFGGHDLSTLFITTARKGLSESELQEFPLSGGIFSASPGPRGITSGFYG